MVKPPKKIDTPEGDPERRDEILRRMFQSESKLHSEIVAERKGKRGAKTERPKEK